jgi:hypothetical protein
MNMNKLGSVAVVLTLAVTLFGCPTRPGPDQDGGDGPTSTGGHPESGGHAGATAGVGGGDAGVAGAGGSLGGSAGGGNGGSVCAAGACPGNFGCLSATTCATTCAPRSTAGCAPGYECVNNACVAATVPCGSTLCQLGKGEQCCVTGSGSSPVYTCGPTGYCGDSLNCDSEADCSSGQICCLTTNGNAFVTDCSTPSSCKGGTYFSAYQACDPGLADPTECLTGACTGVFTLDPALHFCQ